MVSYSNFQAKGFLFYAAVAYVVVIAISLWRAFARIGVEGENRSRQVLIAIGLCVNMYICLVEQPHPCIYILTLSSSSLALGICSFK